MVCAWDSSWGNKRVSMKNSVEVKNISFSYGKTEILNDLSLDIKEGEFMVLLGPSGCGKTTLLNCIAGLLDLTDGQIWIEDDNVTWKEPKDRHIGMVFQSYALYPSMTVEKNLSFGLRMMGTAKDLINDDTPLMTMNSDQLVEWDVVDLFEDCKRFDALIPCFYGEGNAWSYAGVDEDGFVTEVVEKKQVSDYATAGYYYWSKGSDFVKYAKQMIEKGLLGKKSGKVGRKPNHSSSCFPS